LKFILLNLFINIPNMPWGHNVAQEPEIGLYVCLVV